MPPSLRHASGGNADSGVTLAKAREALVEERREKLRCVVFFSFIRFKISDTVLLNTFSSLNDREHRQPWNSVTPVQLPSTCFMNAIDYNCDDYNG